MARRALVALGIVTICAVAAANTSEKNYNPVLRRSLNLSTSHFGASALTDRANSSWGTGTTGAARPPDTRLLTFWGRFLPALTRCRNKVWGYTQSSELVTALGPVSAAYSPACVNMIGPSVEADISVSGKPSHLVRTVASSKGPFGTYGSEGNHGHNRNITATYVAFNPSWQAHHRNRMKPWSAAILRPGRLRAVIKATQSVSNASIPEPSVQQLQQDLRIVFINEQCNISSSRSHCEIALNIKTLLKGFHAYGPEADVRVMNDPAQGGLIVVLGPINHHGKSTLFSGDEGRCTAWSSWGASMANDSFVGARSFQVEVAWDDFLCILRGTTKGDPSPVFGARWNDRTTWVLKNAGYGQENYNAGASTSVVEGYFQRLEVLSVGF